MGFDRLLAHERGHILLVNLAETCRVELLPPEVRKPVLKRLESGLASLRPTPAEKEILGVFREVILSTAARMQVKGVEGPDEDIKLSAVVSFDKIRGLLEKVRMRFPDRTGLIDAILATDAPDATVARAATLLNEIGPRALDLTLSEWGTLFWAAPMQEIDRLFTSCPPAASPMARARAIRDALGLIHLDYTLGDPNRHLFLFRATRSLAEIDPDHATNVSRPTTLDGWDNPRFCQPILPPAPFCHGCGMTVNIAEWQVEPGAAEVVSTPIPIRFFECSYIGPLDKSEFGPDSDFLKMILGSHKLHDLVDYLTNEAA